MTKSIFWCTIDGPRKESVVRASRTNLPPVSKCRNNSLQILDVRHVYLTVLFTSHYHSLWCFSCSSLIKRTPIPFLHEGLLPLEWYPSVYVHNVPWTVSIYLLWFFSYRVPSLLVQNASCPHLCMREMLLDHEVDPAKWNSSDVGIRNILEVDQCMSTQMHMSAGYMIAMKNVKIYIFLNNTV